MGTWRGFAAGLLLVAGFTAASAPSRADPPPPLEATIGDLTFRYNRFNWRIEPAATGLTATCLQIDCKDVVFDFSVHDGAGRCDKDSVLQAAERLFPTADRHPVNLFPAGRFGLVMAESWFGPDFRSPRYVVACLDWQDREYRFTMRPETVGETTWAGGALAYLVSRATTPPPPIGLLRLGALELPYPTEIWRASEMGPGQSYRLSCLAPTCRGEGEVVMVVAEPDDVGCKFDGPDTNGWHHSDTEVTPLVTAELDALDFSIGRTHSPCRNYVPPRRVACAWHAGVAYRIVAPGGIGCKSGFDIPDAAFEGLVKSARLVPAQ
jgi:hypothetical protein